MSFRLLLLAISKMTTVPYISLEGHEILPQAVPRLSHPEANEEFFTGVKYL